MNLKVIMLSVAGLCGLVAYYGTTRYLNRDKPKVEMVDIIVAARNLRYEEIITPDLLRVEKKDKETVPPGALTNLAEIEGRWVSVPMFEGEAIVNQKLAEKGSPPGLKTKIPKGMRAYTMEVNEHSGISGFVLPDDRVDVIQCIQKPNFQVEVTPVLQDVQVLASGTVFSKPEDRTVNARNVTLALTPAQAEILAAAKQGGTLSLSLRGLNDHEIIAAKPKTEPQPSEEPKPVVVVAKTPEPVAPPDAIPPPPPPAAVEKPTFISVYKGIDNMTRIRINRDPSGNDGQLLGGPDAGKEPPAEEAVPSLAGAGGDPSIGP